MLGYCGGYFKNILGVSQKLRLTEAKVKHARPGDRKLKIADGGGLYLLVTPEGGKFWRWKYRFQGKEKTMASDATLKWHWPELATCTSPKATIAVAPPPHTRLLSSDRLYRLCLEDCCSHSRRDSVTADLQDRSMERPPVYRPSRETSTFPYCWHST